MKYLVSSHASYYEIAAAHLVKSLIKCGVSEDSILVVVGGAEERHTEEIGGVEYVFVEHNSFDYTSLIEIVESGRCRESDGWFLLHDTCEAGPKFAELSSDVPTGYEHVSVESSGWTNIGWFSPEMLERVKSYLMRLKDCSKMRAIMAERVFTGLAKRWAIYGDATVEVIGQSIPYGGIQRRILYYPDVDLRKYQANHTPKDDLRMGL